MRKGILISLSAATVVVMIMMIISLSNEKARLMSHWREDQRLIMMLRDEVAALDKAVKVSEAELADLKAPHVDELIATIAKLNHVEPGFVLAIATVENPTFRFTTINVNNDGSLDRGLMQLNDSWFKNDLWFDPYVNVSAGVEHIAWLRSKGLSWWETAVTYNCGYSRRNQPPKQSLVYAEKVMATWQKLEPYNPNNKGGR